MGKNIVSILLIITAVACSSFSCTENEEEIARKELVQKFKQLESVTASEFLLVERVKEFRGKQYDVRAKFEKEQKGKKVRWDLVVRSVDKYTEGIRGATKEYYLVSARPVSSLENTFIDIIIPKTIAMTLQADQHIQCTGFVKYVTLGGDGHVILFPAIITAGK
ncbi:MAG TPA: hypothetical protein PK544_09920 [Spirochaetota bacterium]|nr:hypothetical protein [Spirochaetota bacterium]HPJ37620.1 hypothetical protein [Spirochaetota bacterium]HPQ52930.1 hypothetical protein [Spirochaetota bacterium]